MEINAIHNNVIDEAAERPVRAFWAMGPSLSSRDLANVIGKDRHAAFPHRPADPAQIQGAEELQTALGSKARSETALAVGVLARVDHG